MAGDPSADLRRRAEEAFHAYLDARGECAAPTQDAFLAGQPPELRSSLERLFEDLRELQRLFHGPAAAFEPGRAIAGYRLIRPLGHGANGTVWEAEQSGTERLVALKLLAPHVTLREEGLERFRREARSAARLRHPHIVAVYDSGEEDGVHWIAQELVPGGWTLADLLKRERGRDEPTPDYYRRIAAIVHAVADAIAYVHGEGIVHRDVKPGNILLDEHNRPRVADFGLARIEGAATLSGSSQQLGTLFYMSPEQLSSGERRVDARSDVFSLGATLYECLTFVRPFGGDTPEDVWSKILRRDPPDPRTLRSRVPDGLARICRKALEKRPADRYPTMRAMAEDLRRHVDGEAVLAQDPGPVKRARKWARMHPTRSVLLFGGTLSLAALLVLYADAAEARDRALVATEAADAESLRAQESAREAARRAQELLRLADVERVRALEREADELWPPGPELVPAYEAWLARAAEVVERQPVHRASLEAIRARALPYGEDDRAEDRRTHPDLPRLEGLERKRERLEAEFSRLLDERPDSPRTVAQGAELDALAAGIATLEREVRERRAWRLPTAEEQWEHDTLAGLIASIERLGVGGEGRVGDVRRRLEFARTVDRRTLEGEAVALWDEASASVARSPRYPGLALAPQRGLVPLGADPHSGLEEFAHLQSGEVPRRSESGELELGAEHGIVLVLIPGGTFDMGAQRGDPDGPNHDPMAEVDEAPVHRVELAPYFLGKHEVTQAQWERATGRSPSYYGISSSNSGPDILVHPVEEISWSEAIDGLRRLGLQLPTEAQWERAARGDTTTPWWTGIEKTGLDGAGNLSDGAEKQAQQEVGKLERVEEGWLWDSWAVHATIGYFRPNPFGIHDVVGNVWEWCLDEWGDYSLATRAGDGLRLVEQPSPYRPLRGGSFNSPAEYARSARRGSSVPDYRHSNIGLRAARPLDP